MLTVGFDFLRLLGVDIGDGVVCLGIGMDEFINLGMQSLCVTMGGPLNEEGDVKCRHSRDGMPIECLRLNEEPCNGEDDGGCKGAGMGDRDPCYRQVAGKGLPNGLLRNGGEAFRRWPLRY